MKRKVTLCLVFCVLFTATLIAGTYSGGSGTSGAPYQIADLDDLQELQNTSADWGAYFIQTADIDASATSGWDGGAGFSPIGNGTTPFTGTYNGQGSTIEGLTINRASTSFVGMFGLMDGGLVKNIAMSTNTFTGKIYVGAIAGQAMNSAGIENCFVISSPGNTIVGSTFVGGIIGSIEDGSTLLNSGSVAAVSGERYVGGLVGRNLATITNCYASGSVNGSVSDEGGLVGGDTSTPVVSNSFWDTETSAQATSSGGTGKITAEMKTLTTYTSTATSGLTTPWDFIGTPNDDTGILDWWNMYVVQNINDGYPLPSFMAIPIQPEGSGTSEVPYEIATLNNLYWLTQTSDAWATGVYVEQTADIAAYSTAYINSGLGFLPIANGSNYFYGHYDGDGHLVTGLTINRPDIYDYCGFFGLTDGAVIENLNLREVDIIGYNNEAKTTGGLIGWQAGGSATQCSCTGDVEGSISVGGLVGYLDNATVAECWSSGTVSGSYYIGGLIGNAKTVEGNTVIVSNCYSTADVLASETFTPVAGGLIGLLGTDTNATIERCYSTGSVLPLSSSYTGGFVGFVHSGGTKTATACFWDFQTSGQTAAYGSASPGTITGSITGKTTDEMKGITSGNTISDWGWSTLIWERIGENYPRLKNNPDPTLPVGLSTFTAQFIDNTPTLYWSTQSETDNMGWYVYRNAENDFSSAQMIAGLIEGYGTTTQQQNYVYEDADELEVGSNYYYWLESIGYSGMVNNYDKVAILTIPDQHDPGSGIIPVPERFGLFQNEPNPVISSTKISFNLHQTAQVELNIYNLKGQLVKSLYSGMTSSQSLAWDGSDNKGRKLSAGVYLYKLIVNGKTEDAKKLILMK
ncbi:T9SS C-terminal target domain-containing protein [bacterium]|nr:MAG: T9SS C-terminal target domain-containing protein [bacterium]